MSENSVRTIIDCGNQYRKEYLDPLKGDTLLTDWWKALDFLWGHSFYQGRSDEVSWRVRQAAESVLEQNRLQIEQSYIDGDWGPVKAALSGKIGRGMVGKGRDIQMVLSVFAFLKGIENRNILAHSVRMINEQRIFAHFNELQTIVQVGPKIASFYLRDVVSLFRLDSLVPEDYQILLQPVDSWVRKIAAAIGISGVDDADQVICKSIVGFAKPRSISPILFNQGLWYAGKNGIRLG